MIGKIPDVNSYINTCLDSQTSLKYFKMNDTECCSCVC